MDSTVTVTFSNNINFNYRILCAGNPTLIRGEFFKPVDKENNVHMGVAIEVYQSSLDDAIQAIHNYSKYIADEMK